MVSSRSTRMPSLTLKWLKCTHLLLLLADHNFMRRIPLYFCRPNITLVIRWYTLGELNITQLLNGRKVMCLRVPNDLTEWLFTIIVIQIGGFTRYGGTNLIFWSVFLKNYMHMKMNKIGFQRGCTSFVPHPLDPPLQAAVIALVVTGN